MKVNGMEITKQDEKDCRPSFKKMLKGGESMIQHVLNGGLVLDKK